MVSNGKIIPRHDARIHHVAFLRLLVTLTHSLEDHHTVFFSSSTRITHLSEDKQRSMAYDNSTAPVSKMQDPQEAGPCICALPRGMNKRIRKNKSTEMHYMRRDMTCGSPAPYLHLHHGSNNIFLLTENEGTIAECTFNLSLFSQSHHSAGTWNSICSRWPRKAITNFMIPTGVQISVCTCV